MADVSGSMAPDAAPVEAPVDETNGNFCWVENGRLLHPFDPVPPSPLTAFVHDSFRALALNEHFPCAGGRAAVRQSAYRFGLYNELGGAQSAAALACDLQRFNEDSMLRDSPLRAYVASYIGPVPSNEEQFEARLWATLQRLADLDDSAWVSTRSDDPDSPTFGFSFGGVGFFIVGLHASSSRVARRFAFPTLVFNPHDQFDRLRREGKFARFRDVIRAKDVDLAGTVNPMLRDFGDGSEARQYSGRAVDSEWRCPFRPRDARRREEQ